ncbi:LysR family transcriptional regulator [Acidovorax sp.]|uniref:LysR family transcriptional regulator n=1 Tax=Acidovorax sp. TaxID=1872122 RepID=UPI00391F47EE
MEIYQLRTFLAVARVGHLTRAAEQLHLTQPAVSKQVKALEQELGVLLFERQPTGMVLTKEGRALFPLAERTLFDAMELVNHARGLRGEVAGDVVIGTIIDPDTLRLGSFLGALLAYFPKVQARLQHGISGWVLERVCSGDLHCGFYLGPVLDPDVTSLPMRTLQYVVIGPPHWKERLEQADWAAIAAMPWIGTPSHSSQHRLVHTMFAERGLSVSPVVEADQEASMVSLVRNGVGLATMRDDLAREAQHRGEVSIWPGTVQDCPLSFIFKTTRRDDVLVAACRKALAEVWPSD